MRSIATLPIAILICLAGMLAAADTPPAITVPASASPTTVTGKSSSLRVTATDDHDTAVLTYTWSGPAGVTFGASNGTTTGKTCTAAFPAPGSYTCTVSVQDTIGQVTTSSIAVQVVPTLASLALTPNTTVVNVGATQVFTALAKDQFGAPLDPQPVVTWASTGDGSIDGAGVFTAGPVAGSSTITATAGAKSASRTLRINAGPTMSAPVATVTTVIDGKTALFTAAGADDRPVDELLYTWSATGPTGRTVAFSPRRSLLGEETTATFSGIGSYTITVVVSDKQGLSATSSLVVTVIPTATSLTLAPSTDVVVNPGSTKPFVATVRDQFKAVMWPQPAVSWAVASGAGTIGTDGIYIAGASGPATVSATSGAATGSVTLRVNAAPTVAVPVSTSTPVVSGTTADFSVQGADDDQIDLLTYRWTASGPKGVSFAPRSGTTAEGTTATFAAAGTYTITATITDRQYLSTTSSMTVSVVQTPTSYAVQPASAVLNPKAARIFAVQSRDQFNLAISGATIPATTWTAGGGTVDSTGRYVAGLIPGLFAVTAHLATTVPTTLSSEVRVNAAPTVSQAPVTTGPSPTTSRVIPLSVLGADDGGVGNLRYTWITVGATGVTFSGASQNTLAAQVMTATVPGPGTYVFRAQIRDAQGLSTSADVAVTVLNILPEVTPVAVPPAGAYAAPVLVTLSSSATNGVIRYTRDGTAPTVDSPVAAAPIAIDQSLTLTATVFRDGLPAGPALVAIYTIADPQDPIVTWTTPAPIVYGTALSQAQLAAVSNAPGTWTYNPPAGTVLDAGSQTLTAVFMPEDPLLYRSVTVTTTVQVTQAPTTVAWPTPAGVTWGTALSAAQLNATASQSGTAVYVPAAGFVPEPGQQVLTVTITPTNTNYAPASATVTLQVSKLTPVLVWATPSAIHLGTGLGATQLAATADQAGTFTYTPPLGSVLSEGLHVLRAIFVPADSAHVTAGAVYVRLRVIDVVPPQTTYVYDNANRLTSRVYHDGKADEFGYDQAGRLTSAVSQRYSTQVGRTYDAAGRLDEERLSLDGATYTVGYGYDAANRLTDLQYPGGGHVERTYTTRHQLEGVSLDGVAVAERLYDTGGRLTSTTYHPQQNPLTESRTYHAGSGMVASIRVPGVTDFRYAYDSIWRKTAELDDRVPAQSQHFQYDAASRLIDWKRGTTVATPSARQSWTLTPVGDWNQTATQRDGVTSTETRTHTPVHEISTINGQGLEHDLRGNLSRGLSYADGTEARYGWDVENRLAWASAADEQRGATGTATYRFDALGRRVQKTVFGTTTTYIHAGAQVVETRSAPQAVLPAASAADDGSLVAANGRPPGAEHLGGGGILSAPLQRVNFQPALSPIPEGFVADKGKVLTERSNGLVYGWSAAQEGQVERRVFPVPQFDTHIRMQPEGQSAPGQWSFALPNGTYAVVVVMGDPASRNQTNDIAINGMTKLDATPATAEVEYRQGNFDGYIENITVTDGILHIDALVTALDPKLCFIEISTEGVLATQAERDRLAAVIETANNFTANNHSVAEQIEAYVYGSYIDEVLAYAQTSTGVTVRYFPHSNHQYSVAAITDASGVVVERYSYDAYGTRMVTTPGGTVLPKSTIGFQRGFTGYSLDEETGLYFARTRMYSPTLGVFISRQIWNANMDDDLWPVHPSCLDSYWYDQLLEFTCDGSGSYLQDRFNLYQLMKGDVSNGLEPFSSFMHHPYPLHLGGADGQGLSSMSHNQHMMAHRYLRQQGFGYGNQGRANWSRLSDAQRQFHVEQSLRRGGLSPQQAKQIAQQSMNGAQTGVNRTSERGTSGRAGRGGRPRGGRFGAGGYLGLGIMTLDCFRDQPPMDPYEGLSDELRETFDEQEYQHWEELYERTNSGHNDLPTNENLG